MISAKVICDSTNPAGKRATTFLLTYWWCIHWDFLTHRVLSRNSLSSRAVPIWQMLLMVLRDPAMPIIWGMNGKGMQTKAELPAGKRKLCKLIWILAGYFMVGVVWVLSKIGLHKQDANKLLVPWLHIQTVVTATDWENFFSLRSHKDAHPSMQALADAMLEAYVASTPRKLNAGEWHLPFADDLTPEHWPIEERLKVVVARCARLSYANFDGLFEPDKDFALHDRLLQNGHVSPFEHALRARNDGERSGNVCGYDQYRKMIPGENRVVPDLSALLTERRNAAHHLASVG